MPAARTTSKDGQRRARNARGAVHGQTFMRCVTVPQGDGSYIVKPAPPVREVGPGEAAKILGVSRSTLDRLIDDPFASKIIRWRWLRKKGGKRLFDCESLAAYLAAMKQQSAAR